MVEYKRAREIAEAAIEPMKKALAIEDFDVDVDFYVCSGGDNIAESVMEIDYMRASIAIDPVLQEDEVEVAHSLRHEMLHVLLAEFDHVHDVVRAGLSEEAIAIYDPVYNAAIERTIVRLERVLDRAGLTPEHFLQRSMSMDERTRLAVVGPAGPGRRGGTGIP